MASCAGAPQAMRLLAVALIFLAPPSAWPAPVAVSGVFDYRDTRSDNITGIVPGDFVTAGAVSVVPNGAGGTSGVATHGSVVVALVFIPLSVAANHFSRSHRYAPEVTGSWTLTFTNGADTTVLPTPSVGPVAPAPYPRIVSISGSGSTPTFSWTVPGGFASDGVIVEIFDLESPKETSGTT